LVAVKPFDDLPRSLLFVRFVDEDLVGGIAVDGPLEKEYGEPSLDMLDLSIRGLTDWELMEQDTKAFSGTTVVSDWAPVEIAEEMRRRFKQDLIKKGPRKCL